VAKINIHFIAFAITATSDSTKIIRGSCLCAGVRFEVRSPFIRAGHCHCSRCRKHSGAAVCTQALAPREQFTLLQGDELIRVFGEGQGPVKAFCTVCGSSLFGGRWPRGRLISIRMGSFDDDPGIQPQFHTFVGSRTPWDKITDDLLQFEDAWNDGESSVNSDSASSSA
jgi:hypothetical protein